MTWCGFELFVVFVFLGFGGNERGGFFGDLVFGFCLYLLCWSLGIWEVWFKFWVLKVLGRLSGKMVFLQPRERGREGEGGVYGFGEFEFR